MCFGVILRVSDEITTSLEHTHNHIDMHVQHCLHRTGFQLSVITTPLLSVLV